MMLLEWVYAGLTIGAALGVAIVVMLVIVGTFIAIVFKEDK